MQKTLLVISFHNACKNTESFFAALTRETTFSSLQAILMVDLASTDATLNKLYEQASSLRASGKSAWVCSVDDEVSQVVRGSFIWALRNQYEKVMHLICGHTSGSFTKLTLMSSMLERVGFVSVAGGPTGLMTALFHALYQGNTRSPNSEVFGVQARLLRSIPYELFDRGPSFFWQFNASLTKSGSFYECVRTNGPVSIHAPSILSVLQLCLGCVREIWHRLLGKRALRFRVAKDLCGLNDIVFTIERGAIK